MPDVENINQPRTRKWPFVIVIAAILLVASLAIIYVPQYQAGLYKAQVGNTGELTKTERIQLEKDAVDFANKARTTLAQAIGGLFILGTIGVALWNAKIAQDNARAALQNAQAAQINAETAQKNLKLAEETAQKNLEHLETSKITERFSKAIELLGSEKLDVRIGAIYALERIARDSQPDHWTVMEVLTAFIREHAKPPISTTSSINTTNTEAMIETTDERASNPSTEEVIATDIQAALTVIGRRQWREQEKDNRHLDLSKAYLPNASLTDAHFEGADLSDTHLQRAYLAKAHLEGANLIDAHLEGAYLLATHLQQANLCKVHLEGAFLVTTYLEGADLSDAHFEDAYMFGSPNFNGANLKGVKGLTWEQLARTNINYKPKNLASDLDAKWDEEKKRRDADNTNNKIS